VSLTPRLCRPPKGTGTPCARPTDQMRGAAPSLARHAGCLAADIARNPWTRHASQVWRAIACAPDLGVRWISWALATLRRRCGCAVNSQRTTAEEYSRGLRADRHRLAPGGRRVLTPVAYCDHTRDVNELFRALRRGTAVSVQVWERSSRRISPGSAEGQRVLDACGGARREKRLSARKEKPQWSKCVAVRHRPQRSQRSVTPCSGKTSGRSSCAAEAEHPPRGGRRSVRSHMPRRACWRSV